MLHVVHSDTQVENPVISEYNKRQIRSIEKYSFDSGLSIRVWVASPGLSGDYLVSMLGGRTVASVGNNTKCQQGLKAVPLDKIKKEVRKFIAEQKGIKPKETEIVSLIGTRFDESASRNRMMKERGESATDAVEVMADTGDLVLSPIADWEAFDVFGYIGMVRSKKIECYDDFEELVQVYRDAGGGTCMVNSYLANKEADKAPCSARTGCWTCTRVSRDKSAENMIDSEDGKFEWMRPLNDFRNYLAARHFDPSARCWLGRTVNAETGNLSIMPNSYSPTFTKELLGILLTMQVEEEIAASRLGIAPRFTVLTLRQVIAIELLWARYSYQKPFTAVRMYRAVYERGARYRVPDLAAIPKFTEKDIAFRAEVPFCDEDYDNPFNGLRNIEWAAADCEETTLTRSGKLVTRVNTGSEFDIDEEGAELFYEFDLEHALNRITLNDSPASVAHYLIGLGTVQLYKGTESEWDRMLKVSNQVHRLQLQSILHDPHAIIAKLATVREGSFETGQAVLDLV
ncbi:hypothetical protein A1D17_02720 [Pseudomonas fluorescens]|uniref:Phosphoadenosine phosphosulphate reductase domain-containing protein n=2 Tax=Pseudomonas TaxID=286 RepID=A0A166QLI5_PSEFL|nr:hypothetical protein A1D17_02720 [Pseudomonas fluorescens]